MDSQEDWGTSCCVSSSPQVALLHLSGVNSLCQALCSNPAVATKLKHLDLSGNSLRGDDLPVGRSPVFRSSLIQQDPGAECEFVSPQSLQSFLSHSNCLESLDLSNSDCCLEQVHTPDTHLREKDLYLILLSFKTSFFCGGLFSGMFFLTKRIFETPSCPQHVKNRLLSQVRLTCL